MSTEATPTTPTTLPWKTEPKPEVYGVGNAISGTLELPKHYSVTPNEEIAFIGAVGTTNLEDVDQRVKNTTLNIRVATIALRRIHPSQTESATGELPYTLVLELAEYLIGERNGWKPADPAEDSEDSEGKAPSTGRRSSKKPAPTSAAPTGD